MFVDIWRGRQQHLELQAVYIEHTSYKRFNLRVLANLKLSATSMTSIETFSRNFLFALFLLYNALASLKADRHC